VNIKFVNGSEIKTVPTKERHKEIPAMFYSVSAIKKDLKDMTCIEYYCTHCKKVFHTDYYDDIEPEFTEFQLCTKCGTRFRGWYQC
jgi:protein associated with RNAse G/E